MLQVMAQHGLQRTLQLPVQLPQPGPMLLRPVALAAGEAVAVGRQDPDDPVLQAHDVRLHSQTGAHQLADLLLLLAGHCDRHEVAGPVVMGQVDRIEAIGLASVAGLRGTRLGAMTSQWKPSCSRAALQDVAGAGGLVAAAGGAVIAQPAEHPADGVEIARQALDLGSDRSPNRMAAVMESWWTSIPTQTVSVVYCGHGWAPFGCVHWSSRTNPR